MSKGSYRLFVPSDYNLEDVKLFADRLQERLVKSGSRRGEGPPNRSPVDIPAYLANLQSYYIKIYRCTLNEHQLDEVIEELNLKKYGVKEKCVSGVILGGIKFTLSHKTSCLSGGITPFLAPTLVLPNHVSPANATRP